MTQVISYQDVKSRTIDRGDRRRVPFIDASADDAERPFAFLTEESPGRVIGTHYHTVDQWQIITQGKCKLAREDIAPFYIHFTRAHTPYGPLIADPQEGVSNFVMYTRYQPGAQYVAEKAEQLKMIQDRHPWQLKLEVRFPSQEGRRPTGATKLALVPGSTDGYGLAAYMLVMGPHQEAMTPDPATGSGQFVLFCTGSVIEDGKEKAALAVVHIPPENGPYRIVAGAEGLEALVFNFPTVSMPKSTAEAGGPGTRKWMCALCGFIYDEAKGMPEEGIAPGTSWEEVPEEWSCPDCSAQKSDFEMTEVE